jgi:hypothetical protein
VPGADNINAEAKKFGGYGVNNVLAHSFFFNMCGTI